MRARALRPALGAGRAPGRRRRGRARLRPAAQRGHRAARGRRAASSSSRSTRAASSRASSTGAERAAALRARGRLRRRRQLHDARPVLVPADDRRARPAPGRRGPPRGALRAARRARRASIEGVARHGVRGLGAGGARRSAWSATSTPGTGALHPMRSLGSIGHLGAVPARRRRPGARYKYEILGADGELRLKADPCAYAAELPPKTASVVVDSRARLERRRLAGAARPRPSRSAEPMSIYEVHLGSWRLEPARGQPLARPTSSWPTSWPPTRATWASPTSSCCR